MARSQTIFHFITFFYCTLGYSYVPTLTDQGRSLHWRTTEVEVVVNGQAVTHPSAIEIQTVHFRVH